MDSATLNTTTSSMFPRKISPKLKNPKKIFSYGLRLDAIISTKIYAISSSNGAPPSPSASQAGKLISGGEVKQGRRISSVETLFCYDKAIPEERIEKPVGISLGEKLIGDNPKCIDCQAKGAVLCTTCSGCGLYVDSIMESQGILVKVRCLGCGGTGNIMCTECGGRGHVGPK